MKDEEKLVTAQTIMDKVATDRAKIEKLIASTEDLKTNANQQLRRSFELSASFMRS